MRTPSRYFFAVAVVAIKKLDEVCNIVLVNVIHHCLVKNSFLRVRQSFYLCWLKNLFNTCDHTRQRQKWVIPVLRNFLILFE